MTMGLLWTAALAAVPSEPTTEPAEVRQLVSFLFLPGKAAEAVGLFKGSLLPIYRAAPAMLRFRAFREVESSEPLDLLIVSSFRGMAGMDASNAELRGKVGEIYGRIGALSQTHHDQLVEMMAALEHRRPEEPAPLRVFELLRAVPGRRDAFERILASRVLPLERDLGAVRLSETGRFLLSDGWDYLRLIGVLSLADFQAWDAALRKASWAAEFERLVAARKRMVLREDDELAVR
jgi:hypothetical protein